MELEDKVRGNYYLFVVKRRDGMGRLGGFVMVEGILLF